MGRDFASPLRSHLPEDLVEQDLVDVDRGDVTPLMGGRWVAKTHLHEEKRFTCSFQNPPHRPVGFTTTHDFQ